MTAIQRAAALPPRMRGVLHTAAVPLCLAAGFVLISLAPTAASRTSAAIYAVSAVALFAVSALYHLVSQWNLIAQRHERIDDLGQRQLMRATDSYHLGKSDRVFDPLSPDLHLLTKFEKWRHSLSCGFGDQDLTSGGVGLNARSESDLTSDHAILHSLGRTDISQHDLTCPSRCRNRYSRAPPPC